MTAGQLHANLQFSPQQLSSPLSFLTTVLQRVQNGVYGSWKHFAKVAGRLASRELVAGSMKQSHVLEAHSKQLQISVSAVSCSVSPCFTPARYLFDRSSWGYTQHTVRYCSTKAAVDYKRLCRGSEAMWMTERIRTVQKERLQYKIWVAEKGE